MKHGAEWHTGAMSGTINGKPYSGRGTRQSVPLVNDPNPFRGSQFDATAANRQPTSPKESYAPGNVAPNLTFATVPLTAMGRDVSSMTGSDPRPADLADISKDIPYIEALNRAPVG